jgi:transposase-like protein
MEKVLWCPKCDNCDKVTSSNTGEIINSLHSEDDTKTIRISTQEAATNDSLGKKPTVYKYGFFTRQSGTKVQRYRCLQCKTTYSEATTELEKYQKKRELNQVMYQFLVTTAGLRTTARNLKVSYNMVARRLDYFGKLSHLENALWVNAIKPVEGFSEIQFDDMESFEHTKLKPLSMPIAVDSKNRIILSLFVASMPAKGPMAEISRAKYGPRDDTRKLAWEHTLKETSKLTASNLTILTDKHSSYPKVIRQFIPHLRHEYVKSRKACTVGFGELKLKGYDPMFSFNHTAASFRANTSRLLRRTWFTTKKPERLLMHMKMYQFKHNASIIAKMLGIHNYSPGDSFKDYQFGPAL